MSTHHILGLEQVPRVRLFADLKWYVSWVQNVVRQFGPYLPWVFETCEALSLVREDRDGRTSGVPVVAPAAAPGSYVRTG